MYRVTEKQVEFGNWKRGILYEPSDIEKKPRIAVLCYYMQIASVTELTKRGYPVLFIPREYRDNADTRFVDISNGIKFLRKLPGIEKVILLSWSGGSNNVTCAQAMAEKGVSLFQSDNMLIKMSDIGPIEPADGVIVLDANWGSTMTLISLDPNVQDERTGIYPAEGALDLYDPAVGYQEGNTIYDRDFVKLFQKAQAKRMNRLIDYCIERVKLIDEGKGLYRDDEPMIIPGGECMKFFNKLIDQDPTLMSHTKGAYKLLHAGGEVTTEVIRTLRTFDKGMVATDRLYGSGKFTSVKNFLRQDAVRASADYEYGEDFVRGVEWENVYTCAVNNVKHIEVPFLTMGMTAGYEYLAAETLFKNSASKDKDIAFVEGADHVFKVPAVYKDRGFGDTEQTLYNYLADWLSAGRFD